MNNFEIINFNERMEFQVYKCGGCSHDNIGNEIIDGSVILKILNGSLWLMHDSESSRLVYTSI